jgi:ABC-type branched-subunit amino acid transport system permease subunit
MILGGFGSIMGIVVGAVIVSSVPELLRSSANARPLFYGAILLAILVKLRPWRRLAAELGGLIAFGFAIHLIGSGIFARALDHWMLFPQNAVKIADGAYILLVAAIVMYPQLSRLWRAVLLPPLLYLVMFVWENLLLEHIGGATRLILLGALLVALMNVRPQGLFGTATVEIV